jgi:hypothetical protein
MGLVATQDKRDILRSLAACAANDGKSLAVQLTAALGVANEAIRNGSWLASTSEAGGSVSFGMLAGFTPLTARRCIGELTTLLEQARGYLRDVYALAQSGNAENIRLAILHGKVSQWLIDNIAQNCDAIGLPKDAFLLTQMLGVESHCGPRLHRVGRFQQDFTAIRYGIGFDAVGVAE